jgi:succinate dehydrogenase / fumarate reductase flavoprotein subunit
MINNWFPPSRQSQTSRKRLLSSLVPQSILDRLTDVAMPRLANERPSSESMKVGGYVLPVHRSEALVLGSGAAGLRAAVEMKRRNVDVVIASQSAFGGTSACSGSDKQTLHTANSAGRGDDFRALADALAAGGAMDEDTAYVEAVGSVRALASLQFMGLPLPQDRLGGVLRYQTDHDEVGRATSCGPRTSRLMVQVLTREAIHLGIPIFNHTTGVRLLVASGETRRVIGVLAMAPKRRAEHVWAHRISQQLCCYRDRRPRRTLSRQRLSPALFWLSRSCPGSRN